MKMLADLKAGKPDDAFLFPGDGGFIDPDKFDLEVWKPITEGQGWTVPASMISVTSLRLN